MPPVEEYRKKIKDEKRLAILEAALKEFLLHGYECTSLQKIANTAKVSSGTLFNHYKTKAALFGEIMEQFWEVDSEHEKSPPLAGNPARGLHEIGRDYARLLKLPHTTSLFRVIIAEAPRFPEMGQAIFEKGKEPYQKRLHAYLSSEVKAGTLSVKQVPLAARQFLGMINDLIFWPSMLLVGHRSPASEVELVIDEAVLTFLARYGATRPKTKSRRK
jgi:TetR/AcrR family transcriptional regulator of autoinduction and epiphytic fitness